MCEIELYFAYCSMALDIREEHRRIRDILVAHASIVAPENARDIVEKLELEDELTEEEERVLKSRSKRMFEQQLQHLGPDGKVRSSRMVQEMIRNRKRGGAVPIQSLTQIGEQGGRL